MTKINLYIMENCLACTLLKEKLNNSNISYVEKSSENDLQFLLDNGINKVPVIEINGHMYVGPEAKIKAEEIINDSEKRR